MILSTNLPEKFLLVYGSTDFWEGWDLKSQWHRHFQHVSWKLGPQLWDELWVYWPIGGMEPFSLNILYDSAHCLWQIYIKISQFPFFPSPFDHFHFCPTFTVYPWSDSSSYNNYRLVSEDSSLAFLLKMISWFNFSLKPVVLSKNSKLREMSGPGCFWLDHKIGQIFLEAKNQQELCLLIQDTLSSWTVDNTLL